VGVGQFPKKILHSKKKVYNGSCTRKSAFYYPGPVFDFKKFLAQAIAHQIKTMHNLKGRKKISHQKIAQALPNPSKKNDGPPLSPCDCNGVFTTISM